jgi:ribosomal protein S18 acetylase RimI-like enzyme
MKIWLEANIQVHDFIPESYWQTNYEMVKGLLPKSKILVFEESGEVKGFAGLTGDYIAGIFVDAKSQSKGIGKSLLDSIKHNHSHLTLHVYKKNAGAIRFYLKEGFEITKERIDENTGEAELEMSWTR